MYLVEALFQKRNFSNTKLRPKMPDLYQDESTTAEFLHIS